MRIDDENKVVWCNEELLDWRESFNESYDPIANMMYSISRVGFGWGLVDYHDEELDYKNWYNKQKKELLLAILNKYTFKLEEQKYYWRKKKEHLAWFEECVYLQKIGANLYLSASRFDIAKKPVKTIKVFTEAEARQLLKDDFDKFEKVEIDE